MSTKNIIISSENKIDILKTNKITITQIIGTQKIDEIIIITDKHIHNNDNVGSLKYLKITFDVSHKVDKIKFIIDNVIVDNKYDILNGFFYNNTDYEIIINEMDYHTYYYMFEPSSIENKKNKYIIPYFNVHHHVSEIKYKINEIKNIIHKIKFLLLSMLSTNIPIVQLRNSDYITHKLVSDYNLMYSQNHMGINYYYPYIHNSLVNPNIDKLNDLNKFIFEKIPICMLPIKKIDPLSGKFYSTNLYSNGTILKIDDFYLGIYNNNIAKNIPYTIIYDQILGIIRLLTELKNYTNDSIILTKSDKIKNDGSREEIKTIDEEIDMFKKYTNINIMYALYEKILIDGDAKKDNTEKIYYTYDDKTVEFFIDIAQSYDEFKYKILTLKEIHEMCTIIQKNDSKMNKLIHKLEESCYLLNNIHKIYSLESPTNPFNSIPPSTKYFPTYNPIDPNEFDKIEVLNSKKYHNYCFYIFKYMFKYPTLSFNKSSNQILLNNLTTSNKSKLLSLLFLSFDGLLILKKTYDIEIKNTPGSNKIIKQDLFTNNHELNLIDEINNSELLHKLSSIALKESVVGTHPLYNPNIKSISNKLHNLGKRTEFNIIIDNFYDNLYSGVFINKIKPINDIFNDASPISYDDKLIDSILNIYGILLEIDLTEEIKYHLQNYSYGYKYVPIKLSLL